ncbi:hypothetical protein D3C78_1760140 [compost metagenome]
MVAVAHKPIKIKESVVLANMCNLKKNNKPIFPSYEICQKATELTLKEPLVPYQNINFDFAYHSPEIISDDNMLTEYRHGGNKTGKD